jgi:VanZ family protein
MTVVWAALIFKLSGETFGSSFTAWLLDRILHGVRIQVSAAAFLTLHHLFRKLGHLTEYAIFSLFLYHSLEGRGEHRWRLHTAAWAVLAAGLYSLTDEFHQSFVRGRTASPLDSGIDTLGASIGMLILYGHGKLFHARASNTAETSARTEEKPNGVAGE